MTRAVLALFIGLGLADASASTATTPFSLTVHLTTRASCESIREPRPGPPYVTIRCTPSGHVVSPANFLLHVYRAGEWKGTVEGFTGDGTITTWRIVRVADRDYLEVQVAW